jgi:radical SAM superfamily enzyme YgiQ (UPF0313 family)
MVLCEPVIRPPSEANSFLLQVTLGCSQNSCAFCGAYPDKPFKLKPIEEIEADIAQGAQWYPDTTKVFLCDGDALVLSNEKLIPILKKINKAFPKLSRISSYANAQNILNKKPEELAELVKYKLKIIFLGLESGSNEILKRMNKSATSWEMVEAVVKAKEAGIKSHVIVLLGLGEKIASKTHALETAKVLNLMNPKYISVLSLMLIPGTPLYADYQAGKFIELDSQELLQETFWLIEHLTVAGSIFRCNHASNYLPLEGRLPQDKPKLLGLLRDALDGKVTLKPELFRGL